MIVKVPKLIKTLDCVEIAKPITMLNKLIAMEQVFVQAYAWAEGEASEDICLGNEVKSTKYDKHSTKTIRTILNSPECIVFNLAYEGMTSRMDILKLMVSLPNKFT